MAAACVYAKPPDWGTDSAPVSTGSNPLQEPSRGEWAAKETQEAVSNPLNEISESQASSGQVSGEASGHITKPDHTPAVEQLKDSQLETVSSKAPDDDIKPESNSVFEQLEDSQLEAVSSKAPEDNIKPESNSAVEQLIGSQLEKGNSGQNNPQINPDQALNTTAGGQSPGLLVRSPEVAQDGLRPLSGPDATHELKLNEITDSSHNGDPSASKLLAKDSSGIRHPQENESDHKPHQGAANSGSEDSRPSKSPEQSASEEPEATNGVPEDSSNPKSAGDDRTDLRATSESSAALNVPSTTPSALGPDPTDHPSRSDSKERVAQLKKRFEQSSPTTAPNLSSNLPTATDHSDIPQEALQQSSQSASSASTLDQPTSIPAVSSNPHEAPKRAISHPTPAPSHQPPIKKPIDTGWEGVNLDDPEPLGPAGFFPSTAILGPPSNIRLN